MNITELAKQSGATVDQIRYLEKKGYVLSQWETINTRRVRAYSISEANKVKLIIKYFKQGYRYSVANEKAINEIQNPQLM